MVVAVVHFSTLQQYLSFTSCWSRPHCQSAASTSAERAQELVPLLRPSSAPLPHRWARLSSCRMHLCQLFPRAWLLFTLVSGKELSGSGQISCASQPHLPLLLCFPKITEGQTLSGMLLAALQRHRILEGEKEKGSKRGYVQSSVAQVLPVPKILNVLLKQPCGIKAEWRPVKMRPSWLRHHTCKDWRRGWLPQSPKATPQNQTRGNMSINKQASG